METKGQKTAAHILNCAARCIATIGIDRTSITAIAHQAKVSRGLVAHYFPKKKHLFRQVVERINQISVESIEAPKEMPEGERRVVWMAKSNFSFYAENPEYFKCRLLFWYYAGFKKEFLELNSEMFSRSTRRLERNLGVMLGTFKGHRGYVRDAAESLHHEIFSGVHKYFITSHGLSRKSYEARFLKSIQRRLHEIAELAPRAFPPP